MIQLGCASTCNYSCVRVFLKQRSVFVFVKKKKIMFMFYIISWKCIIIKKKMIIEFYITHELVFGLVTVVATNALYDTYVYCNMFSY